MNHLFIMTGLLAVLPLTVTASRANEPAVRIAKFKDNKVAAVCYTLDDGLRSQYTIAAPIFKRAGVPATFYIISGVVADNAAAATAKEAGTFGGVTWDEVRELAAQGHEIGNHTLTHPNLAQIYDRVELERQIEEGADLLQRELGVFPVSFAYPYDGQRQHTHRAVLRRHAVYRGGYRRIGKADETPAGLNEWLDRLIEKNRWEPGVIHGLEEGTYDPLKPEVLEAHLQYAKSRADTLWLGTYADVARYTQEAEATRARVIEQTADQVTLVLETALDTKLFNVPLTVIIRAPGVTAAGAADADGKAVPVRVAADEVWLDAKPGGAPLTVKFSKQP
ncbi:MAG: polysaccharide deacetylase family protein [Verrucomicrobiales bacterium]|jgi:peptidoglycan/xylan/chitin deacetylase (PgdA/CDA1 family)|nr:polysaccharide deacetylase family protein [Verrucomicrobiales bacterium]